MNEEIKKRIEGRMALAFVDEIRLLMLDQGVSVSDRFTRSVEIAQLGISVIEGFDSFADAIQQRPEDTAAQQLGELLNLSDDDLAAMFGDPQ